MVQDIKITPSGAGDKIPQMLFTGSGATAINMELNVQPDSRLSYESNEGEVFSISKGLQSGVIFAVKDISGLDQISVNASGDMHLAPYYGAIRVGATGIDPAYKLDVFGADGNSWVRTSGISVGTSGVVLADGTPGNTTNALYNVGGTLTFDGSTVGGGGITWDGSTANGVATYKDADEATVESNLTFDGNTLTVATSSSSASPTVVKAAASQTADLTSWQNSAGVSVAAMTSSGVLNVYEVRTSGNQIILGAGANSKTTGGSTHSSTCVVIGPNAGASQDSIAIGAGATATTNRTGSEASIAIGHNASATHKRAISIGNTSSTNGKHETICIGNEADSFAQSVAIGYGAIAGGSAVSETGSVAIGRRTKAVGVGALALGTREDQVVDNTNAIGDCAIAIGGGAQATQGTYVIASGNTAAAVAISGVYGSYMALPNDQKLAVGGNVPTYTVDALGHGAMVRATGVIVGNSGIVLASNTPSVTTNTLYNDGGTLSFNGSTVGGGGITWDGSTANGVATYKDADEATVESNLTFDGSTLTVTGDLSLTGSLTSAGEFPFVSGVAAYASGNTANIDFGSNVQGDILYHNGTSFIRLAKGTDNYVLTMDGSNPVWEAAGGGSAAGSDTQVQFNDGGSAFGGDADFTWNKTTNVMTVNGHIAASTKSFLIDHPTKPDKKLQYACLEGPENGVYVRGHTNDNLIDLPNYWTALVDPESITVQLTAKDAPQPFLYVSGVLNNQVHLISDREISAYYVVNATRKDVEPLLVEPNNYSN